MRKIILSIIGTLLIVLSFIISKKLIANKKKPKPVKAKVVKTVFIDTVKNGSIKIVIPSNGVLTAKRRMELYAETEGVFKPSFPLFKSGQSYKKGQTLIKIDASEYYASVQSTKSNLYNKITAIMPDLRLDFPTVYNKWENYLKNFDLNKTTPKLPEMSSDKENYFITGQGIVSSYYDVKNLEQRLTKYNIYAPFSGVLTEALVTEGTLIRKGQKLGEFIDTSAYEMEVAVSESYASFLALNKMVNLTNIEGTENYTGKIIRINGSVDSSTQTISVFMEVNGKELKEGMYLNALLDAKEETNAIEINRNLLTENNEIFIVRDSILDLLPVKPVYFSKTKVVLKDVPNDVVIVKKQVAGAYAGMLVKPYVNNAKKVK